MPDEKPNPIARITKPNLAGSNHKNQEIALYRNTITDLAQGPIIRLKAAHSLLIKFGPSKRNVPFLRAIIKEFVDDQGEAGERAMKLKLKLAKAIGLREEAKAIEIPEEIPEVVPEPSSNPEQPAVTAMPAAIVTPSQEDSEVAKRQCAKDFFDELRRRGASFPDGVPTNQVSGDLKS